MPPISVAFRWYRCHQTPEIVGFAKFSQKMRCHPERSEGTCFSLVVAATNGVVIPTGARSAERRDLQFSIVSVGAPSFAERRVGILCGPQRNLSVPCGELFENLAHLAS
jgi:hypothetical protein